MKITTKELENIIKEEVTECIRKEHFRTFLG